MQFDFLWEKYLLRDFMDFVTHVYSNATLNLTMYINNLSHEIP